MTTLNNINEPLKFNISHTTTTQTEAIPFTTENQTNPTLEEVRVNMAEMKAENKPIKLVTSVGSCVAVCLHDAANICGGLAHIMLPNSSIAPLEPLPAKFADTAVPALAKAVRKFSGNESRISSKIAGGTNMFPNMTAKNPAFTQNERSKTAPTTHSSKHQRIWRQCHRRSFSLFSLNKGGVEKNRTTGTSSNSQPLFYGASKGSLKLCQHSIIQ